MKKKLTKKQKMAALRNYRKEAITAARELFYPPEVVTKIRLADTEREISDILMNARKKMYA